MAGPGYRDHERERERARGRDRGHEADHPRRRAPVYDDERDIYYENRQPPVRRVIEYVDRESRDPPPVQYFREYDDRNYEAANYRGRVPRPDMREVSVVYMRPPAPTKHYSKYYNDQYEDDPNAYYDEYVPPVSKKHKAMTATTYNSTNETTAYSNNNSTTDNSASAHLNSIYVRATPIDKAESPVIRRNKELRQRNQRRSSLGNRGKRLTSIGNGLVAMPHRDIPAKDYYKHLDTDLPEADQMRQLLLWCAKRQSEKIQEEIKAKRQELSAHSSDSSGSSSAAAAATALNEELTALNIAKSIQEDILKDLSSGNISTDWHNRSDKAVFLKSQKPNKQNLAMKENYKIFTQKLKDLEKERSIWVSELMNLTEYSKDNYNKLRAQLETVTSQLEDEITNISQSASHSSDDLKTAEDQIEQLESLLTRLQEGASKIDSINRSSNIFISRQQKRLTTLVEHQEATDTTVSNLTSNRTILRALSKLLEET